MDIALPFDKGLGNNTVYARLTNGTQYYDFVAKTWGVEGANCRVFLSEFANSSSMQSWYYGSLVIPGGGPYPVEIVDGVGGDSIGNDITPVDASTPLPTGTILCVDPIRFAQRQIQDVAGKIWPPSVLLVYLNYAVREIIDFKPEAYTVTGNITLIAGTKQASPSSKSIFEAKRNMGAGATPGKAILVVDREMLKSSLPDWHTHQAKTEVLYVILDDRNPEVFDVYPPQPANTTQQIEAVWPDTPAKAIDLSQALPLPADYESMIADLIVAYALREETAVPNALAKSMMIHAAVIQRLGGKTSAEDKTTAKGR